MYIKVVAVPNDIKVAYFSKIDFEDNLFNKNFAQLLSIIISSSITEIIRHNKDLKSCSIGFTVISNQLMAAVSAVDQCQHQQENYYFCVSN